VGKVEKIWALCEPAIDELGMELVEVEHVRAYGGSVIRLYVDREGGVTVDDCATVSREIGYLLDAEDVIRARHYLEVSSPGIDRVLRKREHFQRFRGRPLRVVTSEPIEGSRKISGRIGECTEDTLYVETDNAETIEIPLILIHKANLRGEIPFGDGRKKSKKGKV
jgi:ribosome maturation factor RimP